MLKVFAEPASSRNARRNANGRRRNAAGTNGSSANRPGSGNNYARPASQQRRGSEDMTQYYRRTGVSALGGNVRTRGIPAPINPVNRGR